LAANDRLSPAAISSAAPRTNLQELNRRLHSALVELGAAITVAPTAVLERPPLTVSQTCHWEVVDVQEEHA
jgi:hypothetical protein